MHYSASKNGFYSPAIHGDNMPADAIEIPDEEYQALLKGQSEGKQIRPSESGKPVLEDPPKPSIDTQRKRKANEIRLAFTEALEEPVAANGQEWNGGMDSAMAIDGWVRIAEQGGLTEVELFDISNDSHVVTIAEGKEIAVAIGKDYQPKLARKQQLLKQIEVATEEQLGDIAWQ